MENEIISGHKTLLQKYEIPLEHLDFEYLRTCTDKKKVERIFRILKSGEEGYFPDLTKFAENRLQELDPKNKLLRTESTALYKYNLNDDARKDLENGIKVIISRFYIQTGILHQKIFLVLARLVINC